MRCSASIANNISYGNPGVDQAGIEAAARAAHCYDFIMQLPLGFDTPVGERVRALSWSAVSMDPLELQLQDPSMPLAVHHSTCLLMNTAKLLSRAELSCRC